MIKRIVSLVILCTLMSSASFAELTAEQRVRDAQSVIDLFQHRYAPMPWKEELYGINYEIMGEELLASARAASSDEEFYQAIALYLGTFQDAHVQYSFPTSYRMVLGIDADDIGGDVIITYIARDLLPERVFPFNVGDRIAAIDGVPVDDLRAELMLTDSIGTPRADARNAAQNLVWRDQYKFPLMPEGSASITIEPFDGSSPSTVVIPWHQGGMPLAPIASTSMDLGRSKAAMTTPRQELTALGRLRTIMSSVGANKFRGEMEIDAPPFMLWSDFRRIEDSPLFAGTFSAGGKQIGFIRIETFSESDERMNRIFDFLRRTIPRLQDTTDALILDLTRNGGGDLCYGEALAGYFIGQPIPGVATRIKPTRTWVTDFEWMLEAVEGDDLVILLNMIEETRRALIKGNALTEPMRLCAPLDHVPPATAWDSVEKTYTKPLLILVDALSASMGEIFPAMLQDPGRALIFGERSMGAGGNVVPVGPLGNSDIMVSITESLIWRSRKVTLADGTTTRYLENIGVIPDYPYDMTIEDFLFGYEGYRAAIESALKNMIDAQSFD